MYNAIIIEDEYLLANVLENYLAQESKINLVGKFENPLEGLKYLHSNKVDLVFLDIQMPLLNGVDLAKMIPKEVAVVFTTAYSEYAVEGFELNALDYLLKPISLKRFNESISRFLQTKEKVEPMITNNKSPNDTYITVKADSALHKIELNQLLYVESLKEYVRYCTLDRKYIVYGSLSKITDELVSQGFIRIHKSTLISKKHITSIGGNQVYLTNNLVFPIGRSYKSDLLEQLKTH